MYKRQEVVNNIMKQSFPSIVDANFTANMEGLLDMVEAVSYTHLDVYKRQGSSSEF